MGEQYYSLKEAAAELGFTNEELLDQGINARIAIMLPFRILDGKRRYIYPVDLMDISDAYGGKESTDLVEVALSAEEARAMTFDEDYELVIDPLNPKFDGITKGNLFVTQEEIDRYLQENEVTHKNEEANQSKANDAGRPQSKLADFQKMDNLRFGEITINLDSDNLMLRVSARDIKDRHVPFSELGLTQENRITPNSAGNAFLNLARQVFDPEAKGQKRAIPRLSEALRAAFDTSDTPLRKYRPVFKITVPKDIEAKQKANWLTTTYDDDIKPSDGDDLSDNWLRKNDPNYKP